MIDHCCALLPCEPVCLAARTRNHSFSDLRPNRQHRDEAILAVSRWGEVCGALTRQWALAVAPPCELAAAAASLRAPRSPRPAPPPRQVYRT